jgi:hypothetical protein
MSNIEDMFLLLKYKAKCKVQHIPSIKGTDSKRINFFLMFEHCIAM